MATPTKCEEKRQEDANPQTGYRTRLLGKETYAYTAPGAMDNRDDRATERSGAKEKEEGTPSRKKAEAARPPRKKPQAGAKQQPNRIHKQKEEGGEGGGGKEAGRPPRRPWGKRRPRDPGG